MENKNVEAQASKDGVIIRTKFSVFGLVFTRIILPIIMLIFMAILTGVCLLLPVIGWIIAIVLLIVNIAAIISFIIDLIAFIFSYAKLTETGIEGRTATFGSVDLTYDQITSIEVSKQKKALFINTNIPKNKKGTKMKQFVISNCANGSEFYAAYTEQLVKIKAAAATEENATEACEE